MNRWVSITLLSISLLVFAGCGATPGATAPTPTIAPPPTSAPTAAPTAAPTSAPTAAPTAIPTAAPTVAPTAAPTVAPSPIPTVAARNAPPVRLTIEAIGLDRQLFPVGLDADRVPVVLDHDVAWYKYGAMPGQGENVVLWGHVLRFHKTPQIPAPFARLQELQPGAAIVLTDEYGNTHRYVVTRQVWAEPDEVEYMLPQGREQVTLISCIGDKVIADGSVEMTHRLITIAEPAVGG